MEVEVDEAFVAVTQLLQSGSCFSTTHPPTVESVRPSESTCRRSVCALRDTGRVRVSSACLSLNAGAEAKGSAVGERPTPPCVFPGAGQTRTPDRPQGTNRNGG